MNAFRFILLLSLNQPALKIAFILKGGNCIFVFHVSKVGNYSRG